MSLTVRPGGKLCFSLSAFSRSFTQSVYRYLLQRTLNFTTSLDFLILTAVQSARSTSESAASNRPGPTGELRVPEPHGEAPRATQLPEGQPRFNPCATAGQRRTFGVLPPRRQQEVLDLGDLLRLPRKERRGETQSGPGRTRHPPPWAQPGQRWQQDGPPFFRKVKSTPAKPRGRGRKDRKKKSGLINGCACLPSGACPVRGCPGSQHRTAPTVYTPIPDADRQTDRSLVEKKHAPRAHDR